MKLRQSLISRTPDGVIDRQTSEFECRILPEEGEAYTIIYIDKENHGTTRIEVQPDQLRLQRRGQVSSQMQFELGATHVCPYRTPMGNLSLNIHTTRLDIAADSVRVEYDILADGSVMVHNVLCLSLHEC